jgi:hypothetical protein
MEVQGKRLRLLYPDLHGLERGEYLYGEKAVEGVAAFCVGVYPLTHDKEILPYRGHSSTSDCTTSTQR